MNRVELLRLVLSKRSLSKFPQLIHIRKCLITYIMMQKLPKVSDKDSLYRWICAIVIFRTMYPDEWKRILKQLKNSKPQNYSTLPKLAEKLKKVLFSPSFTKDLSFITKYDPGLSKQDLAMEIFLDLWRVLLERAGFHTEKHLENLALKTAHNLKRNLISKYTAQKRTRIRRSRNPDREYEATVVSWDPIYPVLCDSLKYEQEHPDFIAVENIRRRFHNQPKKLKMLDLVLNGYSLKEAAKIVGAIPATVKKFSEEVSKILETKGEEHEKC